MSKPLIFVTNTASTAVAASAVVPFSVPPVRRYCQNVIDLSGNAVTISDCYANYYLVTVNATFTAPAAGDVSLELLQNGNAVTGAKASATVTTASTETNSLSFQSIIRATAGKTNDFLTVKNNGVAATFTNVAMTVSRL